MIDFRKRIKSGEFPSSITDSSLKARGVQQGTDAEIAAGVTGGAWQYIGDGPTRDEQFSMARDKLQTNSVFTNTESGNLGTGIMDSILVFDNLKKELYKTVKSGVAGVGYEMGMNPDFEGLYNTPLFGGEGRGTTGPLGSGGGGWQQFCGTLKRVD